MSSPNARPAGEAPASICSFAVRSSHIPQVFMVQAQSKAASVGIILPLPHDIPVLAQVEIATARTMKAGHRMVPQIADHLPAVIPRGLTACVLYDDPAVHEDFGLGHPPDGLPDIGAQSSYPHFPGIVFLSSALLSSGTLRLRVETLRNAARELYDVMRRITGRRELADGTLRQLRITVEELEIAFGLIFVSYER
ncbi:hypothetical protein SCP_0409740 [Sparassis crispa]|uniref:Uncharacterized protein n=1 Tax=Sparassis crispa TaxID=139825 RepID=A0A401GKA3_9APHY|nr:hypothetical protein SCP_0409740 [Sparassis crispa]GBE82590.1 hypothetical protein SCP_0409740 [Sparassis crispa]